MKVSNRDAMERLIRVLTTTSPLRPGTIIWLDPDEVVAWGPLVELIVRLQGTPYALLVSRDYSEVSILPLPGLPKADACDTLSWPQSAALTKGDAP